MNYKKFIYAYKRDQMNGIFNVFLGKIGSKFRFKTSIQKRIKFLEKELKKISKNIVIEGPYKGMRLPKNYIWNEYDYCPKVLGLYENEIQKKLSRFNFETFINIGCAEGYHLIGQIFSNKKKAIGFEVDNSFIKILQKTSIQNNCYERIKLFEKAKDNFVDILINNNINLEKSCFLIDIEGKEFDILKDENLKKLQQSKIIIEFHPQKIEEENINFLNLLKSYFNLEIFQTGERSLSSYKELKDFSDVDRWLMVSEHRPCLMNWIVCHPK